MDLKISQRRVIVTGGASGIGEATAKAFAREGSSVAIIDIDPDQAARVLREIRTDGGLAEYFQVNLSSEQEIQYGVDTVVEKIGDIDILVNNAALYAQGDVLSFQKKDLENLLAVNIEGVLWMTRYVSQNMINSGKNGVVVNVASEAGLVGISNQVIYNLTKAAVISITQSCAIDLAPRGIRINCVCPGTTDTPLVEKAISRAKDPDLTRRNLESSRPLHRLGRAEEIASAIMMMASQAVGYATGAVLSIDGGYTAW